MKSIVKFAGIIALCLGLLGFILLMATPSLTVMGMSLSGIDGIFGEAAQWSGTLAWVLALLALIMLVLGCVLPMLKVTALEKFNKIFKIVAAILLVFAGIFTFCEAAVANGDSPVKVADLGAGWIVSGILFILGGIFSILPAFAKAE